MEVCYEYRGLVAWWYDLGAQAQVACVAAIIALLIYALNRWHARSDLLAKRKALHAMLRGSVKHTLYLADKVLSAVTREDQTEAKAWDTLVRGTINSQRLVKLQLNLISVARHGDDAITAFIEICREYDRRVDILNSLDPDVAALVRTLLITGTEQSS